MLDRGKSQDDSRPHVVCIHSCGEGSQGWKTGILAFAIVQMYGSDSGIEMVTTVVFIIGFYNYIYILQVLSLYIVHNIVRVQVQIYQLFIH